MTGLPDDHGQAGWHALARPISLFCPPLWLLCRPLMRGLVLLMIVAGMRPRSLTLCPRCLAHALISALRSRPGPRSGATAPAAAPTLARVVMYGEILRSLPAFSEVKSIS